MAKKITLKAALTIMIFAMIFSSSVTWKYAKRSIQPSVPCTVTWSDGEIHEYR